MSESQDATGGVARAGGGQRSRRAMREAERAAEREAALTGQQPVLTRRELKRLREEQEALQAAIEAGEITLEQARALQDPLADAPRIDIPPLHATGTHASLPARLAGEEPVAMTSAAQDQRATAPTPDAPESSGSTPVPAQALAAEASEAVAPAAGPDAEAPAPAGEAPAPAAAALAAPAPAPATPRESADGDTKETAAVARTEVDAAEEARRQALAEVATGELAAQDVPVPPAASAPLRRSLRDRHESPAPAAPGSWNAVVTGATPASGSPAGQSSAAEGAAVPTSTGSVPARRPIVRIPTGAQGVRTVDASTGELSAVTPVNEDLGPIETPRWKALHEAGNQTGAAGAAAVFAPVTSAGVPEAGTPATDAAQSAPSDSPQAGPTERRPWSHHFLTVLFLLVLVLVVATLVWFYLGRAGQNQAGALALTDLPTTLHLE